MYTKFIKNVLTSIILSAIVIENTESVPLREEHFRKRMIVDQFHTGVSNASARDSDMKKMICNSKTAWVVIFYDRFHPSPPGFKQNWISLGRSIREWRDIVVLAIVDCISPLTHNLCEENSVNNSSSVKYFSPGYDSYGKGHELTKINTVEDMRHGIIENLMKDQQHGKGDTWPNILPFRGTKAKRIWKVVPDTVRYLVFFFEKTTSFLGSEMILDLHGLKYLEIRRVTENNHRFCTKQNVTSFPVIVIMGKKEDQVQRNLSIPTMNNVVQIIQDYMKSKGREYIVDPSQL